MYLLTLFLHGSKVITRAVTNFRTLTRTSCPFYGRLTLKHRPEVTRRLDFFHSKKYIMLWIIYDKKNTPKAHCLVLDNCILLFLKHDFLETITSYIQASIVCLEKHLGCVLPWKVWDGRGCWMGHTLDFPPGRFAFIETWADIPSEVFLKVLAL